MQIYRAQGARTNKGKNLTFHVLLNVATEFFYLPNPKKGGMIQMQDQIQQSAIWIAARRCVMRRIASNGFEMTT